MLHLAETKVPLRIGREERRKKPPMIKKTFRVTDMTCPNCALKLENLEDSLDGVKQINASYHKLIMVVEYDESLLTEEQIVAAVKKKGYRAEPI